MAYAPDDVLDEATIRTAAYLYDEPAGRMTAPQNAFVHSAALSLLSFWRPQRAYALGKDGVSDDED